MQTPNEKAPVRDGYIGAFYKSCWDIIKTDIMVALREMFELWVGSWNLLNTANIALIAKKQDAQVMGDYMPISIMHSMAKLFGKILTVQLAPHLDHIVSRSQITFIKGRTIHDNFQYIQGAIKHFHHSKTPMLFLKLDIARAFDIVCCEYLLELMEKIGLGKRWQDIMALIWSTTTSRLLVNGEAGKPILHGRGLRQGDPLSPMIFILALDPLHWLLDMATDSGLLHPIGANLVRLRTSLYADDTSLFLHLIASDVSNFHYLLQSFGSAMGLCTNIHKSELLPIRCEDIDVPGILGPFQVKLVELPCRYLGLPIRCGRLKRKSNH
jgi:hypothetical protein